VELGLLLREARHKGIVGDAEDTTRSEELADQKGHALELVQGFRAIHWSTRLQFVDHSRVSRGHRSAFSMQSEEGGLLVPELSRVTAGHNERLEASAGLID